MGHCSCGVETCTGPMDRQPHCFKCFKPFALHARRYGVGYALEGVPEHGPVAAYCKECWEAWEATLPPPKTREPEEPFATRRTPTQTPEEWSMERVMSTPGLVCRIPFWRKDCPCEIHEGPHWLHMDGLVRTLNLKLLEGAGPLQVLAFAQHELVRLKAKREEMEREGILYIPEQYCRPDLDARGNSC